MLDIFDVQLLTALYQLIEVFVGAIGADKHIVIQRDIEAGAVADQHLAVAIQNIATGSLDPGAGSKGGGIVDISSGLVPFVPV